MKYGKAAIPRNGMIKACSKIKKALPSSQEKIARENT
jgi:hypothetical protein